MVLAERMTAFAHLVVRVLFVCSYDQMRRVDAARRVARVHDNFSRRNLLSIEVLVGKPVGANLLAALENDDPVPGAMCGSSPEPTTIRLLDAPFKGILCRDLLERIQLSLTPILNVMASAKVALLRWPFAEKAQAGLRMIWHPLIISTYRRSGQP